MRRPVLLIVLSTTLGLALVGMASCSTTEPDPPLRPATDARTAESSADPDPEPDTGSVVPREDAAMVEASVTPGPDVTPPPPGEVFAHSPTTLFKLEPISKKLTRVGDFDCTNADAGLKQVIDIAVDKTGKMFGTTFGSLIQIDRFTGQCAVVATATTGSFPNSLSFVPAGTVNATSETLVGFSIDEYVKIDTATGEMTTIGNLNPNPLNIAFRSSGDIVSIAGGKTYLTARSDDADAGGVGDYLLEINPSTGKAERLVVDIKKKQLFGLGYWAGTAYAFSATGDSYAIDLSNGFTTTLSFPNAPNADAGGWFGAGATTTAPAR